MFYCKNKSRQTCLKRHPSEQNWYVHLIYKGSRLIWLLYFSLLLFSGLADTVSAATPNGDGNGDTLNCNGGGLRSIQRSGKLDIIESIAWDDKYLNNKNNSVQANLGVIEGRVWNDIDGLGNDRFSASGVTVICKCAEGFEDPRWPDKKVSVVTDEAGYYQITNLNEGQYIIEIVVPLNTELTADTQDSNIDPIKRISDRIEFTDARTHFVVNAGLIPLPFQYKRGDVNCDSEVNNLDALFILQKDIRWRDEVSQCPPSPVLQPGEPIYGLSCDINGDGICNSIDALVIFQCDIGRNNSFCPANPIVAADAQRNREDTVSTQEKAAISIATQNVTPGSTFTATLMATVEEELSVATIDVAYDPSQFRIANCQIDKDEHFDITDCNIDLAEKVSLGYLSVSEVSGTLHLADITFEHIGTVLENSPLSINARTFAGPDGSQIPFTKTNGAISIGYRAYLPVVER